MPKTIAILGGSFNPPHEGHFEMGRHIYETLGVDEVWIMFSINRFKDPAQYASIEDRMEMGRIMAKHYPDIPFVMSDVEDRMDTHESYFVMQKLKEENPGDNFIWVMGADNLIEFHNWSHAEEFLNEIPIAIVDREPYTTQARESSILRHHPGIETGAPADLLDHARENRGGVCFVGNPGLSMSSSHLLEEMRQGKRDFDGPFQDVADHILEKGLYGFDRPAKTPGPTPSTRPPAP